MGNLYSSDLEVVPVAYIKYNSTGGNLNYNDQGDVKLMGCGLNFQTSFNKFFLEGKFIYNSVHGVSRTPFLFSKVQGIEFPSNYSFGKGFWYEYSTMRLSYQIENFQMDFGKFNRKLGPGIHSIVLSEKSPSYPQFGFNWNISPALTSAPI